MPTAEEIAFALGSEFLRDGRFTAASGPVDVPPIMQAVAANIDNNDNFVEDIGQFGGLSVQAVGFEEGNENPAVHIYITKGSQKLVRSLPREVSGIRIKVNKMGAISVRPESAYTSTNGGNVYERNGRICCGSSCAPTSENTVGTMGSLVKINGSNDIYILSNNHVLGGCNHVPKGQPILAPGSGDGRPNVRSPGEVARHEVIEELRTGSPNFVSPMKLDLALATVSDERNVSSWQGDSTDGYDTPSVISHPRSLMRVKKFGRTTGLSNGVIGAKVSVPTPITYNAKHFKGVVWFKDVWTVKSASSSPFALPGDSGSLVVTEDAQAAVGVLFAANTTGEYGWIIPIQDVLGTFGGLNLLSDHGI